MSGFIQYIAISYNCSNYIIFEIKVQCIYSLNHLCWCNILLLLLLLFCENWTTLACTQLQNLHEICQGDKFIINVKNRYFVQFTVILLSLCISRVIMKKKNCFLQIWLLTISTNVPRSSARNSLMMACRSVNFSLRLLRLSSSMFAHKCLLLVS